jgi:hypothetical protein
VNRRAAVVAGVFLVTACGADRVPAGAVAAEAADVLAERTGVRSVVDCPAGLEAEAGTEVRCVLTPTGAAERYGVTVRVTSVEGDEVTVDVQVDGVPLPEDAAVG